MSENKPIIRRTSHGEPAGKVRGIFEIKQMHGATKKTQKQIEEIRERFLKPLPQTPKKKK